MPTRKPQRTATLDSVLGEVSRLADRVDRLSKSVFMLAGRIEPFDNEFVPERRVDYDFREGSLVPNLEGVINTLKQIDDHVYNIEFDLRATRAKLDQISDDVYLKDDIKPYIDTKRKKS